MGPAAGASAQTASIAASVIQACEQLQQPLRAMARRTGGGSTEEILRHAKVPYVEAVVGSETRLGRIAGRARFLPSYLLSSRRWIKAASGVQFCEVRVDAETGETRVSRWVGVFDIGRVINAKTAASQLRGGVVMGLGLAMTEETLVDPRTGTGVAAAVANAVHHATGKRVRDLPITVDKLL